MYYALVTLFALIMATSVGFFHPNRHGKVITGGIAGFIIGLVLIVYGRFYYESPLNPFPVTASDIMFAGLTLGVIGFITAFGLSLFVHQSREKSSSHMFDVKTLATGAASTEQAHRDRPPLL